MSCDFVYGNYVPFGLDLGACLFLLLETVSYGQAFREGMDRLPRMRELRCAQLLGHACQLIRRRTLHWNHGPNEGPHGSAIIEIGYLNDDGNLESNCLWILRIVYTVI